MIKKEDIIHINKKASQTPFAGYDFAYDAINQLSYALMLFRKKYEDKRYIQSSSAGPHDGCLHE